MRKVCTTAVFVALAWLSATGQAARMDSLSLSTTSILNPSITVVVPVAGASITVCTFPASGQTASTPCTNKAQVCTDQTATSCNNTSNNPFASDAQGNWGAWVNPGAYDVSICTSPPVSCAGPYHYLLPTGFNTSTGVTSIGAEASAAVSAPSGIVGSGVRWFDTGSSRFKFNNNNSGADFYVGQSTVDTLSNKTLTAPNSGNSVTLLNGNGVQTAQTGTGSFITITNFTYTIPANTLQTGKKLHITASTQHTSGSASVSTQWLVAGGTINMGSSNFGQFRTDLYAQIVGGATQKFVVTNWSSVPVFGAQATTLTFDPTVNNTISLQFSAPNTDQVAGLDWTVEVIQ